ncbi:MAG: transposase, partial [Niameybacter sp.]
NITITLQEEKEQAKKVGLEQGLEQGEKRKALEVAKTAIAKGLDDETISELTGIPIEEIKMLRNFL